MVFSIRCAFLPSFLKFHNRIGILILQIRHQIQTLNTTLSLASLIGQRTAYIGFTGSTGGLRMRQEITSFSYATSSSDICATRTTCKTCAAAQCNWCDGVCTLRNTNASICSRTCPVTRTTPAPAPVAAPTQAPVGDVCLQRTDCGSCTVDGRCTWSTASKRSGVCSARKTSDRFSAKTFLAPLQCLAGSSVAHASVSREHVLTWNFDP